jgi:sugar phosphate isomerase/epimerase
MDRREFFQKSLVASVAGAVLADATLARARQTPTATPATPTPPTPRKLILDAYSRNFHWLRTADEMAEAAIEITCGGVMPTVGTGGAHVDIAKVATDLPLFVNTIRKHGLRVKQIRGGGQTAVDASVEALVGTMGQLGVTHYWLGTDNYNLTKPIVPQLDAIKTKVDQFVKLNQKHGTTLMYHTRAGASSVGSVVWDLLYVFKDFDPKHVGIHWDTGHMALHGPMWETLMRTAGPYVVGMSWKDRSWAQNLGFAGETGPYPGPAGAGDAGGRGAPGGGRRGGRGGGAVGADAGAPGGAGRGGPPGEAGPAGPPAGAGGPGGGPGGRGGGGRGGGRGAGDLSGVPRPLAGNAFARGGTWMSPEVPMGTGLVDIFKYAQVLHDIGFDGPMELEAEYPLGGSNTGATEITLPRIQVIGSLKRDVLTIRAGLAQSGTGLTI